MRNRGDAVCKKAGTVLWEPPIRAFLRMSEDYYPAEDEELGMDETSIPPNQGRVVAPSPGYNLCDVF